MSLVSLGSDANPAEYFRLELACLLGLRPTPSPLLAAAVFAQGVRSGSSALQELKAGMAQSATRLMTVCWTFNGCIFFGTTHIQQQRRVRQRRVSKVITPSLSSACCCVYSLWVFQCKSLRLEDKTVVPMKTDT